MRRRHARESRIGDPPLVEVRFRVPRDLLEYARARAARERVAVGTLLRNLLGAVLRRGHEEAEVHPTRA